MYDVRTCINMYRVCILYRISRSLIQVTVIKSCLEEIIFKCIVFIKLLLKVLRESGILASRNRKNVIII